MLYTNNKRSEREIKETIPFTIATKRIKYPGVNVPKEAKHLYSENYKTLMRDFPGGAVVKNLPANAGDMGSSPGLGRSHMPRSN